MVVVECHSTVVKSPLTNNPIVYCTYFCLHSGMQNGALAQKALQKKAVRLLLGSRYFYGRRQGIRMHENEN